MTVEYKNKKLEKICLDHRKAQKNYGANMARLLQQRISELKSAKSLADIKRLPAARLHSLKGDRKGQWAVDLEHPYRLVMRPVVEEGQSIERLDSIKIVCIKEVTDYHG